MKFCYYNVGYLTSCILFIEQQFTKKLLEICFFDNFQKNNRISLLAWHLLGFIRILRVYIYKRNWTTCLEKTRIFTTGRIADYICYC